MAKIGYRVEHLYSLEDKSEEDISPLWRMFQLLFYVFCVVLGFGLCYCFSHVMDVMHHNCLLYSKIAFYQDTGSVERLTFDIKLVESEFKDSCCNLVIFVPIITTVIASFLFVLFCISGRGGRGNDIIPEAWRLVIPVMMANLICFCTSLYLADIFHKGLKAFLVVIATYMRKEKIELINIRNLQLEGIQIGPALIKYLTMTKHVMWMMVSSWGLSFFWVFLRCIFIVDFQLVRTSIYMYPKTSAYIPSPTVTIDEVPVESDDSPSTNSLKSRSAQTIRHRTVGFAPNIEVVSNTEIQLSSKDASTSVSSSSFLPPTLDKSNEEQTKAKSSSNDDLIKKS